MNRPQHDGRFCFYFTSNREAASQCSRGMMESNLFCKRVTVAVLRTDKRDKARSKNTSWGAAAINQEKP